MTEGWTEDEIRNEECPIARVWRDIRVTRIFAGANDIMKTIAARFMGL